MNNELLTALGELQDRLKKLEAATLMLGDAKRQAEACATAARDTTLAASAVVLRTQELREVTLAVAALPATITAIKETLVAVSEQLRLELKTSVIEIHGRHSEQTDRLLHTLTDRVSPEILQGIDRSEAKLSVQQVAQADQTRTSLAKSQSAISADLGLKFSQMQKRLTIAVFFSGLAVIIAIGLIAKLFLSR
jgi:hypothetical protein